MAIAHPHDSSGYLLGMECDGVMNQSSVKTKVSFGQGKAKKARASLNMGHIRTGQGEKSKRESEYGSHSDSSRRKKLDSV